VSRIIRPGHNSSPEHPPFVLHWGEGTVPLPVRPIRPQGRRPQSFPQLEAPPWVESGPLGETFDFGERVRRLCADIVARCGELQHVDMSRLLIGVTQARNGHAHGLQARVTPLRFRNGSLTRKRRGVVWQVQRFFVDGREMLYLMTFCLPRFLDQDFDEKFITVFHELYHISPEFDGDLRRHKGRYTIHSHSQKCYDENMSHLARAYVSSGADPALHGFLRLDFAQLLRRHGSVVGVMVPRPRLLPLPGSGGESG
jgi:predicted metallopeptidase